MGPMRVKESVTECSEREERLSKIGLSDLWNVVEGGAWPLALLDHVLPESLRSKQIETSTSDLELERTKSQ